MKRVLLVEVDIPEDTEPKEWAKEQLGPTANVRLLRYKDFEDYEHGLDEYWRFG